MTTSYSRDPAASSKDAVRFYLQDTADPFFFSDEEIAYQLTVYPGPLLCSATLARTIAMLYARKADKAVGDLRINWSQISKQYQALATELETKALIEGVRPYSGGISIADKRAVNQNTDRSKPPFQLREFDNPDGQSEIGGMDGGFCTGDGL